MTLGLAGVVRMTVEEAAELLDGYPNRTLELYDSGPSSGMDAVGPAEIGRLIVIEPLSKEVATSLMAKAQEAPWHLVPADARLEDADPEGDLYWDANRLYGFFDDLPGVGRAITSKLLHMKRPAFFPILDSVVVTLYGDAALRACSRAQRVHSELPGASRLYWAAIQEDLLANQAALRELRQLLITSGTAKPRRLATLSAVRLVDMLAWRWGTTRSA